MFKNWRKESKYWILILLTSWYLISFQKFELSEIGLLISQILFYVFTFFIIKQQRARLLINCTFYLILNYYIFQLPFQIVFLGFFVLGCLFHCLPISFLQRKTIRHLGMLIFGLGLAGLILIPLL